MVTMCSESTENTTSVQVYCEFSVPSELNTMCSEYTGDVVII